MKEAKINLKYGKIQVSERRYGVIEWHGCSCRGDIGEQDARAGVGAEGNLILHTFRFVEGFERVSWSEAEAELLRLEQIHSKILKQHAAIVANRADRAERSSSSKESKD